MSQVEDSIKLFEEMAAAISAKYLANVEAMAVNTGIKPGFDELMQQLRLLEQELTHRGIEYIEAYDARKGSTGDITPGLKLVIRRTIEGFIRQL